MRPKQKSLLLFVFSLLFFIPGGFLCSILRAEEESFQESKQPVIKFMTPNEAALERRRIILQEWENQEKARSGSSRFVKEAVDPKKVKEKARAKLEQKQAPEEKKAERKAALQQKKQDLSDKKVQKKQSRDLKIAEQKVFRLKRRQEKQEDETEKKLEEYKAIYGQDLAMALIKLEQDQEETWNQFVE